MSKRSNLEHRFIGQVSQHCVYKVVNCIRANVPSDRTDTAQIFLNRTFGHMNVQLEPIAAEAFGAPGEILAVHLLDQAMVCDAS